MTGTSMSLAGARLGVAVSGGADSVVLLHLLERMRNTFAFELSVLHVNHKLRGADSDEDERFVRELAFRFGLPFCRVECPPAERGNLEQEARDARRAFFLQARADQRLLAVITGHTRSDQAETVLLRALRGAGTRGLSGMQAITPDGLWRPLLSTSREEVRRWAAKEGIAWREDASNQDPRFQRNFLRNQVLPLLRAHVNPKVEDALSGLGLQARAEEEFWTAYLGPVYRQMARESPFGLLLSVPELQGLQPAAQRRVLRQACEDVRGDLRGLDFSHFERVRELCAAQEGHDRAMVPRLDALRSYDRLRLTDPAVAAPPRDYWIPLVIGQEVILPGGTGRLGLQWRRQETKNCVTVVGEPEGVSNIPALGRNSLKTLPNGVLAVRNWRPGDAYLRAGHITPNKIKTLFQEHRIYLWERRHWPVVVAQGEIVWARRFGVAAGWAATQEDDGAVEIVDRPA